MDSLEEAKLVYLGVEFAKLEEGQDASQILIVLHLTGVHAV